MNKTYTVTGTRILGEWKSPFIQYHDRYTNRIVGDIDYYKGDENILFVSVINREYSMHNNLFKIYGVKIEHFE